MTSLLLPKCFHYSWMKNEPFKTIFTLNVTKVYMNGHEAIKVFQQQSLLESVVSYHIQMSTKFKFTKAMWQRKEESSF